MIHIKVLSIKKVDLVLLANENLEDISSFKEMYMASAYRFRKLSGKYSDVKSFVGNYAAVKVENLWGFIDENGTFVLDAVFEDADSMISQKAAVKKDGEYYFIDIDGDRVLASLESFEKIYSFYGGLAVAKKNGKYGYIDQKMVPGKMEWDFATNFDDGTAALKQGDKWAIVDSAGKFLSGYVFDDIKINEQLVCCTNGVLFAKKEGKYMMSNSKGVAVTSQQYDAACLFEDSGPAAVKSGNQWGFVDNQGNVMIEPRYEEARSFNIGLAPVKVDGLWGYINSDGTVVIEPEYEDTRPFAGNRTAAVKKDGMWRFIQLEMD